MTVAALVLGVLIFAGVTVALVRLRPEPPPATLTIRARVDVGAFRAGMLRVGEQARRLGLGYGPFLESMRSFDAAMRRLEETLLSVPPTVDPTLHADLVRRVARAYRVPVRLLSDDVRPSRLEWLLLWKWRVDDGLAAIAEGFSRAVRRLT